MSRFGFVWSAPQRVCSAKYPTVGYFPAKSRPFLPVGEYLTERYAARMRSHDEQAREWFERRRWTGRPLCPFCTKAEAVKALTGKSMGEGWFHCRTCRKKFTVRVGTIMARSHVPLGKWLEVFGLLDEPDRNHKTLTAAQISRAIKITRKSAHLMLSRINPRTQRRLRHWYGPHWWEGTE